MFCKTQLLATCVLSASLCIMGCASSAKVQVWYNQGEHFNFAERALIDQSTGVCFSGGGTRAMTCAIGQMKGLDSLGLWDDIGYISSVSGGTWASSIFTYYNGTAPQSEFLGTALPPERLTLAQLDQMSEHFLGRAVTCDLIADLAERIVKASLSDGIAQAIDDIWIDGVGHCYLEPFGLYDVDHPRYFTYDRSSRDMIIENNPKLQLDSNDFHLVYREAPRPYLVMNSSILGPAELLPLETANVMADFNYTPLYVGSAKALDVTYTPRFFDKQQHRIGGGFIEPFAMGSTAPRSEPEADCTDDDLKSRCAKVRMPRGRFSLAHAAGTSSAAYAATAGASVALQLPTELLFGFTMDQGIPEEEYWPVDESELIEAMNYRFADGGSLENYGLITLLQRKVKRIAVFINTNTPIDINYEPGPDRTPCPTTIDSDLYPLFGYPSGNMINNKVFSKADFAKVFDGLRQAKLNGGTVLSKDTLVTESNRWWGIPGGDTVTVLWVYNETVRNWEDQLATDTQQELAQCANGKFPDFPGYKLMFEDPPYLVRLTIPQINLLYQLSAWNVYSNEEVFEFLKE